MTGHENLKPARKVTPPSNRNFGLVFAGVFLLIGLWPALRHGDGIRWWALAAGAAFAGLAVLKDSALAPLNGIWFKLGLALHAVMGPLVMGLLYFCVVSPIGAALKILAKDPLRLRKSSASTYWISREPAGPARNSMKQQF